MDLQSANRHLAAGNDLNRDQMQDVMRLIMHGEATPAQIGAFLTALTIKGETVEEIVGAAIMMRQLAAKVETRAQKIVDTVGTGGDGAKLFNVSTASALVASAAGANMAKHGNRAATGNSGSADVLEAAGVNIAITPEQVGQCIDQVGIGFMFAPTHHAATRHAIGPRREIGIRTIFNLLGPLTNPADAQCQLVGVFDQKWVRPLAEVFAELGSRHTMVVCSDDGTDEISIAAGTEVAEFKDGAISTYRIEPEQFGIEKTPLDTIIVEDAGHSLRLIKEALSGVAGPAFDMVAINAGATIYAADLAEDLTAGVELAKEVLTSGKALDKLSALVKLTANFEETN
ncbi:MAG: anthranilate phosphoribosyltransferase [Acidiferrobacterales bacterium]|nr:anthranilate phosphoribosyltransferase [Acidiferrobacterales bacterium]